jgi:hypothetical protein
VYVQVVAVELLGEFDVIQDASLRPAFTIYFLTESAIAWTEQGDEATGRLQPMEE